MLCGVTRGKTQAIGSASGADTGELSRRQSMRNLHFLYIIDALTGSDSPGMASVAFHIARQCGDAIAARNSR